MKLKLDKRQTRALVIIGVILVLYIIYNELQKNDSFSKAKELLGK